MAYTEEKLFLLLLLGLVLGVGHYLPDMIRQLIEPTNSPKDKLMLVLMPVVILGFLFAGGAYVPAMVRGLK